MFKFEIPEYFDYWPDVRQKSKEIQLAYNQLSNAWDRGEYVELPNIQMRTAYIFYYLYDTNTQFFMSKDKDRLDKISSKYLTILNFYGKQFPKLSRYAATWMVSMARKIKDNKIIDIWTNYYLDHPVPDKRHTEQRRILLNLYYYDKNSYIPPKLFNDILPIHSKLTPFGQEFEDEILNYIVQKVEKQYEETGVNYVYDLFNLKEDRINIPSTATFENEDPYIDDVDSVIATMDSTKIRKFIKNCENEWREQQDLPKIGEGWIHETQLYETLKNTFDMTDVEQHARPIFLGNQHYDVYFPEYNIACEYQGEQHYKSISYFGGEDSLKSNKERDARKKRISNNNNVDLIYVMPGYDMSELVGAIAEKMGIDKPEIKMVREDELPGLSALKGYKASK